MATPTFSTLESVFNMTTPTDLTGLVDVNLGGQPNIADQGAFAQLLNVLENSGRGVYTAADLKEQLNAVSQKLPGGQGIDLSTYLDFYSTQGIVSTLGDLVQPSLAYQKADGSKGSIAPTAQGMQEIIGADFTPPNGKLPFDVTIIESRAPFFNPTTRNTKRAEVFLNSMPSIVLAQLVPFLQVEFQMTRSPSNLVQTPGLLKFLLGSADKSTLSSADKATVEGHQVAGLAGDQNQPELDFAGMEMFTSPQTLVNPQPNQNVGAHGTRYVPVIDPFRPFASVETCVVSVVPAGAGFYTYKKATLTIKVHDRSRLSEISDLIRPRVYTGVTVWLTYGWRAPVRPGNNLYFDYVNNNMLMREAYGIINSNFSFDTVGQVTLTLELFTKGINEMRTSKVSDNLNDLSFQFQQLRELGEKIAQYRQALNLDPQQGVNKEIRAFQILDAAESQTFPANLSSKKDIDAAVQALKKTLDKTKGIDKVAQSNLISALDEYVKGYNKIDPSNKFNLPQKVATRVTETVAAMFAEVLTGPDPFLMVDVKGFKSNVSLPTDLMKLVASYNKAPATRVKTAQKSVVSFGKLFTVFVIRNLLSTATVDEVQVFFYNLNDSCGPVSGTSVAAFPIDMNMFIDQYSGYVKEHGGEKMTLEEFIGLVVNAQFLDPRAIGYGMQGAYKPYDTKHPDLQRLDTEGNQASQLDKWSEKYGVFKQPTVEMYIEVSHQRVSDSSNGDVLQYLNYSARDATSLTASQLSGLASKQIMRIHVYDKQLHPYKAAAQLLRRDDGAGFIELPGTDYTKSKFTDAAEQSQGDISQAMKAQIDYDAATGKVHIVNPQSNQQVKDVVSKMVPTIRFGCNGTTVTAANLASKADPALSSVQMQRTMTIRNDAGPNGSGEGGIPLRVIPAQLSLTTLGNCLATMAQMYFCDFQTGTTADALYCVTGLTHTIAPGKFETQWSLCYADGYGVWEGAQPITKFVAQYPATITGDTSP